MDELRDITNNFGPKALIGEDEGEGSYGKAFYGVLKSGKAAFIKKLDPSKQPYQEFISKVYICYNVCHPNIYVCKSHHFFFFFFLLLTLEVFNT